MEYGDNRWQQRLAPLLCGWVAIFLAACGGGAGESGIPGAPAPGNPPVTAGGSGRLTITVVDPGRRPLRNAEVSIRRNDGNPPTNTGIDGSANFSAVPERVSVQVSHALGRAESTVAVAQSGITTVEIVLLPDLPRPTVTLLPVEIVPGSVSADRRELSLRVELVSSRAAPFIRSGRPVDQASPYLGLEFSPTDWASRDCSVFVSRDYPVPTCASWGTPPYAVTIESFGYDEVGTVPLPADSVGSSNAMLLLEQSERIAAFDHDDVRRLAAQHFIDRYIAGSASPRMLSIAGFAATGTGGVSAPQLPATPLWAPRGAGPLFSGDITVLHSDVGVLAPLVGGSAPVFDAIRLAVAATMSEPVAGRRSVVGLVGGDDGSGLSEPQRAAALESLRQQRLDSGVQTILVGALQRADYAERARIADLAEALHAPLVSSGTIYYEAEMTTGAPHLYAAMELAADLFEGARLPTLSATFRVRAPAAGHFIAGTSLRGVLYVQSETCPFECTEVASSFSVRIP